MLLSHAAVLLVLLATIPGSILSAREDYANRVVEYCVAQAKRFEQTEDKYATNYEGEDEPSLTGPEIPEMQRIVYQKEILQRPFECIGNIFNGSWEVLQSCPRYKDLVHKCKSEQPYLQCDFLYPFRMIDGTCNNPDNPTWGSSLSCVKRLLKANYKGVYGVRKSVCGGNPLPDSRSITLYLSTDRDRSSVKYNSLLITWMQILSHDITDYSTSYINDKRIGCCSNPNRKNQHPQCYPILLPLDDPFYSKHDISCVNFVRRAPCDTCSVGKRIPINGPTAYIDCSFVYGLTDKIAQGLRANDGTGKLKTQEAETGEQLLPPFKTDGPSGCGDSEKQQYCFRTGDRRANQHTTLTMLHTLFLREHNRLAEELKKRNPHWDDETLYQVARKINIAQFQVIVYNEVLPLLVGPVLMATYRLAIGSSTKYDRSVNPAIRVEFNSAVFRLHTLIPGKVILHAASESETLLRSMYGNSVPLYDGEMTSYLSQMTLAPAQKHDRYMSRDTTDFLYKIQPGSYGFDLSALDVQRGRDLGIPTYVEVFHYMRDNEKRIADFEDLYDYMDPKCVDIMKQLYCDVRDIDLWVGLNCENVPDDMAISPTSAIIIALQFRKLKIGDRFYWEHDNNFSKEQRQTLKNASVARLLCDNTDAVMEFPKALELPGIRSIPRLCPDIPSVNLDKWTDNIDYYE